MELPTSHRVPLSWLLAHGGESIRLRVVRELAPPGFVPPEPVEAMVQAVVASKQVAAVTKKQKDTGLWGGNLLALAPSATAGIKEVGTIPQYRRLLQLGLPTDQRAYRLADRLLYRLLSRDESPELLFEYQKGVKGEEKAAAVVRSWLREAACCALAEAGHLEDPRLRGAAHKVANEISHFLRSEIVEKPWVRAGTGTALHPEAYPPSWYSVAMIASMPNLQRERAGFTERLGHYLAQPAPKKAFVIQAGKKSLKPHYLILGDPIETDAKGNAKDIPLALHYGELLARMHALQWAPVATRALARLYADCDETGVWAPKTLKAVPKVVHKVTWHEWPLVAESKTVEARSVDVTFRLALISKHLGIPLEYT
ncbi:MAG: hypothetical protein NW201_07230 [Gemmatimonadales bacterium]|nr:hypothetical protein [Gemmatimonadales bacterium]